MKMVLDPLFSPSEEDPGGLTPRLATSWQVSPDKLSIIFKLRQGVSWSDGHPFTAEDVLFTYRTIMDPAVDSEGTRGSFMDIEAVEALDEFSIRVRFKRPTWKGLFVFGSSLYVLPRRWYQERIKEIAQAEGLQAGSQPGQAGFGERFNTIQEPCPGTGPYHMPEGGWARGERLTLRRTQGAWRSQVEPGTWNLETIRWRFIQDRTQRLNQARQEKIDVLVIKQDEWQDSLSREPAISDNYRCYSYDNSRRAYNYIVWNCRRFPFDDARVRRAMTQLVDRVGFLRDLWRDEGQVASCPNKPIYPEYNHDLRPLPFDPQAAAKLLAEAGFQDVDGDGILDKKVGQDWRPFSFRFKIPSGMPEFKKLASGLREALTRVGVKMQVQPLEYATFLKDLTRRDFDAASLYKSFSDPWVDHYQGFHSSEDKERGGNLAGLRLEEVDRLLEDARREYEPERRIPLYHRLYELLQEQQPMTLLVHGRVYVLLHKRFRNVIPGHAGIHPTYWWVHPDETLY